MSLSIAVISSNQDRNIGVIPGYNECGGMRILATKVVDAANAAGLNAIHFQPALESADKTQYEALYRAFPAARLWLDKARANGDTTLVMHLHSDAGGGSHSGYCYSTKRPVSETLGRLLAEQCQTTLDTARLLAFDRTDWLWDRHAGNHNAVYLEVCAHDVKSDLEHLYASVDALASALVEGLLAWAPAPAGETEVVALRRENAELRQALQQIAAIAGSKA